MDNGNSYVSPLTCSEVGVGLNSSVVYQIIESAEERAKREEAKFMREEARLRREEAKEEVLHVEYFVRIDGRMQSKEGYTNSRRIFSNIDIINSKISTRKYRWKIHVTPIEDDKKLTEVQHSDGGCIRVREQGKDYGDKVDGIHEVDNEWWKEVDEDESYFIEYYEGVWVTRDCEPP